MSIVRRLRDSIGRVVVGLRAAMGRVPRAAWACALVALANGLAWSLIVPPFQVPDENAHYAYVQQVAERGTVPRQVLPEGRLSPARGRHARSCSASPDRRRARQPRAASAAPAERDRSRRSEPLSTRGDGDALSATNNPPLYYALEAVPYKLAPSGTRARQTGAHAACSRR